MSNKKFFTMAEVSKHNKRDDAWIIVEGRAYDVTNYVELHPGGWLPIANLAGRDCTDAFANYHPARVYEKILPSFYVGDVSDYKVSNFVKEHREIRQQLLERGLFETDMSFYYKHDAWLTTLFVSFVVCTLVYPSYYLLGAVFLAAFWQQLAFVGHDIGHNGITHNRHIDGPVGIVIGNTLGGIGIGWWKRSHNVHHVVCNSIENDPDIQHLPFLAVTDSIFGKFWSTYHQKWMVTDDIARFMVQYQHILYYPIMALARFNLYAQSWLLLLSNEKVYYKSVEIMGLTFFASWMIFVVASLPSWSAALAFLLISHGLAGLLHVQITLSHFSMDTYHGQAYNDDSDEWFRMQLKTTMDVDCPPWMDWFHGGLQFQIEHHLFPRLPRHNLREARTLVKAFCAKHDVHYHEPQFIAANKEMIGALREAAYAARKLTKGNGGFYHSKLWDGMNALS